MRKEFCHHTRGTMSARSRTAAGSREHGATKNGTGSLLRDPSPTPYTIALATCSSVYPRKCVWNLLHVVLCLTAFSARLWFSMQTPASPDSRQHGKRFISQETRILWLVSQSVLSSNTHKILGLSLVRDESTSTRSWCQLHGSLCNWQDSSHRALHTADRGDVIACDCVFLLVTARSGWRKPQFCDTSFEGCSSPSGAARLNGKLRDCVMFQDRLSRSRSHSRIGWAMALRIKCTTTTVTALSATAATTLSLRVCVLLVSILTTRRRRRVPSTMSNSPSSSTRASLVSSVKTHFARPPSQDSTAVNAHHLCAESVGRK